LKTSPPTRLFVATLSEVTPPKHFPKRRVTDHVRLPIVEKGGVSFVDPETVCFIGCEGNYCRISTDEKTFHIRGVLKEIIKKYAGASLLRVHRSYALNPDRVALLRKEANGTGTAFFDSKKLGPVPVSKRAMGLLRERWKGKG